MDGSPGTRLYVQGAFHPQASARIDQTPDSASEVLPASSDLYVLLLVLYTAHGCCTDSWAV